MDERSDDAPYQGTGRKQPPRGASGKQARPKSISGNMSYQEFIEQPKPRKAQEPIKRTRSHNNVTIEMLGPFVQNNPGSPAPTDGSEANQALLDPHGSDHGHHHPPLGSRHRRSSAANSIGSFSVSSINTFIENEHAAIKEGAFQHGQHPPLPQQPTGYNAPFGGGMSDGIFHSPVAASSVSSASQPTPTMLYGRPPNPDVSPPFFRGGDALTGPPNQSSPDFSAVTGGARRNVTSVSPPRPPASSEAQDPASRYLSSQAELLNYLQHLKDENRALKLELQESNRRNQELLAQLQNAGGFGMKSSTPTPQNTGAYAQQSHQFGSQPHFGHDVAMDRPPNAQPAPTSGMLIRYEENGEWTPLGMVDLGSFMPVPGGMAPPAAVPMQSPLPQGQMMAASWGKDPDHFRAGTPVQRQSPAVQDGAVPYRPNMTPPSHARDWGQGAGQAPPQDGQIATLFGP
ncbi:hypothetical protein DFJ74DRAFT_640845 [Hyaloraphidium curvatum]|nr:hypothetical protein DFJ74DRAFT_640845 [Hyaloraphidium curvatum]